MSLYTNQQPLGTRMIKKLAPIAAIAALVVAPAVHSEEFRGHEGEREHHEIARMRDHHDFAVRDVPSVQPCRA